MINFPPLKIAIASGKGGTGKTMLAVSLASLLSRREDTLLADLDVEEPNDALFLKGREGGVSDRYRMVPQWEQDKCVICNICSSSCKYHSVVRLGDIIAVFSHLCHSCHACSELCPHDALPMTKHKIGEIREIYDGRLTLVEGRLNTGEEQGVPLINQVHELAEREYGTVPVHIFDCPPGTSCPVVAAVKKCDYVVLVTEPTPFGLNDLILAVKTVRQTGKQMGVVINRDGIGTADIQGYCMKENIDIIARIPYDRRIAELYSEGKVITDQVNYMEPVLQGIIGSIRKRAEVR